MWPDYRHDDDAEVTRLDREPTPRPAPKNQRTQYHTKNLTTLPGTAVPWYTSGFK